MKKVLLIVFVFAGLVVGAIATVPSSTTYVQYTLSTNPQTLSVPFVFQNAADLLVLDTRSTAAPVTLTLNSDYSVAGGSGSTGSVTTIAGGSHGVLVGDIITVSRAVPLTQTVSFTNTGPFTAAMVGQALDKQTQISQQINLNGLRSLQFGGDETLSGVLPKTSRSGKYLAFDANGAPSFLDATSFPTSAAANTVYAGPATGSAAAPSFRALVNADLPSAVSFSNLSVTMADATFAAKFIGTTGRVRIAGYYDATWGTWFQALNTAESAWVPITLDGSTVRLASSGTLVASVSSTGLAVTGSVNVTNGGTASLHTFTGTNGAIWAKSLDDASGAAFVQFLNGSGSAIGSITRVTTTNAVAYNTTSDARLKTNIRDFTDSGRLIDSLRPRLFDWKSGGADAIGFIAQEENAADPAFARIGAVTVGDDDPQTITHQWQRSDQALVPILVAEIKALRARVEALEKAKP